MHFTTSSILLLLPFTLTLAAPLNVLASSGEMTYFHPGLGACGGNHGDGDMIVAISSNRYDAADQCGRRIKVRGDAGETVVKVVDRCVGCAPDDLDLSPEAFKAAVGTLGVGRTRASWQWA